MKIGTTVINRALVQGRLVAGLLYQVEAGDPLRLAGTAAVIIVLATAASAIPAMRASGQDPVQTLRAK